MVIIRNIEKILIGYMAELSKPTEDANYIPVSYVDEYNRRRKELENEYRNKCCKYFCYHSSKSTFHAN